MPRASGFWTLARVGEGLPGIRLTKLRIRRGRRSHSRRPEAQALRKFVARVARVGPWCVVQWRGSVSGAAPYAMLLNRDRHQVTLPPVCCISAFLVVSFATCIQSLVLQCSATSSTMSFAHRCFGRPARRYEPQTRSGSHNAAILTTLENLQSLALITTVIIK